MKKLLLSIVILCSAQFASAEIVEVYRWKAFPGQGAELLAAAQEAASIHKAMGASVQINQLDIGSTQNMDYVLRYDDLSSWGRLKDMNATSADWTAFFTRFAEDPPGELVESIFATNTDAATMADDFTDVSAFSVFVWDPVPGGSVALTEGFSAAKLIHENLGARVETYIESFGGTDKMHYVMLFDSWTHMAEVTEALSTDEAWLAFNAATLGATDPTAILVQSFAGSVLANF